MPFGVCLYHYSWTVVDEMPCRWLLPRSLLGACSSSRLRLRPGRTSSSLSSSPSNALSATLKRWVFFSPLWFPSLLWLSFVWVLADLVAWWLSLFARTHRKNKPYQANCRVLATKRETPKTTCKCGKLWPRLSALLLGYDKNELFETVDLVAWSPDNLVPINFAPTRCKRSSQQNFYSLTRPSH